MPAGDLLARRHDAEPGSPRDSTIGNWSVCPSPMRSAGKSHAASTGCGRVSYHGGLPLPQRLGGCRCGTLPIQPSGAIRHRWPHQGAVLRRDHGSGEPGHL